MPRDTLPFRTILAWRAWHEWPGVLALATGILLWILLATSVVLPLANALTRLGAERPADVPAWCSPPAHEALAGRFDACTTPSADPEPVEG